MDRKQTYEQLEPHIRRIVASKYAGRRDLEDLIVVALAKVWEVIPKIKAAMPAAAQVSFCITCALNAVGCEIRSPRGREETIDAIAHRVQRCGARTMRRRSVVASVRLRRAQHLFLASLAEARAVELSVIMREAVAEKIARERQALEAREKMEVSP